MRAGLHAVEDSVEVGAMNRQTILAGLLVLGTISAAEAHDRERHDPQTYLGAGFADFAVDAQDFGYDADDNGVKLLAGFKINDYLAAELGYLGGARIVDEGLFDVEQVDLRALSGSIVGRLPVTSTLSIFGKVGVARYQLDFDWLVDGRIVESDRIRDDELIYGFGLTADLGSRFQIRGEYEAIDKAFDVISISGVFKFR
jgi:OmpA-OmpF porin, OOP family